MILRDSCCVASLWCEDFGRLLLCLRCCGVRILTDLFCVASLWCEDFDRLLLCLQRCLGLRFLFPVYYIPEVEVTAGKFTSTGTIEKGGA